MSGERFSAQLGGARDRFGPVVHPVLHLEAELIGDDAALSVASAREAVLKWASSGSRVGRLPQAAWRYESFDHMPGGNAAYGVRFKSDGLDCWALRCDLFTRGHDDGITRTFTTEVSVVEAAGRGLMALSLQVVTHELEPGFVPTVPGIVRQVAKWPGLYADGRRIIERPWIVADEVAAHELVDLIESPSRRLPVVVISLDEGETDPAGAAFDVATLTSKVIGLVHVAVVTGPMTFVLTETWDRQWSCYHRGVRTYLPGFDRIEQSPFQHPLVLGHVVEHWSERRGEQFPAHLQSALANGSLRRARAAQKSLRFSAIREHSLLQAREQARASGEGDAERLRLAELQIIALTGERDQHWQSMLDEEKRADAAEARAKAADAQWHTLQQRIAKLEQRLAVRGDGADADIPIPASLDVVKEWADEHLAGRIVVTSKAANAAKKAVFEDTALAYRALLFLAIEYQFYRIKGGNEYEQACARRLDELKLQNNPTGDVDIREGGERFRVDWGGQRMPLDMHLKRGGNTHDPRRCFRLYYFWDEERQIAVVGSLPEHIRTGAT